MPAKNVTIVSFSIPNQLLSLVDEIAVKCGLSRSKLISKVLHEEVVHRQVSLVEARIAQLDELLTDVRYDIVLRGHFTTNSGRKRYQLDAGLSKKQQERLVTYLDADRERNKLQAALTELKAAA